MSKNRFGLDFTLWGNQKIKNVEKSCCPDSLPDRQCQKSEKSENSANRDAADETDESYVQKEPEKRGFIKGIFITDPEPELLKGCPVEITAVNDCKCAEVSLFAMRDGNEYDLHETKQVHFDNGKAKTVLKLYCDVDEPGKDGYFLNNYKKEKLTVDYFFKVKWRGYKELKSEILTMPVAPPDIELQLLSPEVDSGGMHKQYINLRQNDGSNGQQLKLRAGPKSENVKLQKVFWRVTAGSENSTIQDELPEIIKNGDTPVSFVLNTPDKTSEIETNAVNNEASIVLNCGCAGGDTFTVEISSDGINFRSSIIIENWRKLWYQLTYPEGMKKPPMEMLKEGYNDVFIELEEKEVNVILQNDPFPQGTWVEGADIGLSPGKKLVFGSHNSKQLHSLFKNNAVPFELHLIFCDVMLEIMKENEIFSKPGSILVEKQDLVKPVHNNASNNLYASISINDGFEGDFIALPKALHNGHTSVFNVTMKAFDKDWNPKPLQGAELSYIFKTEEYYVDYAHHVNERGRMFFQLPEDAVTIINNGGRVRISFDVYLVKNKSMGQSDVNKIVITKRTRLTEKASEERTAMIVMHEIGHAIGMASSKSPTFYEGKGHVGSHCSYGMISRKVGKGDYKWQRKDGGAVASKNSNYPCVMFGSARDDVPTAFCEKCSPIVKAQKIPEFKV